MVRIVSRLAILKLLKEAECTSVETRVLMESLEKSGHGMSQPLFSQGVKELERLGLLTSKKKPLGKRGTTLRVYSITPKGIAEVEKFETLGTAAVGGDGEAGA